MPGVTLPDTIRVTDLLETEPDDILLLCVPMQTLSDFLERHQPKASLVACCKGIDLKTGHGPTKIMASHANGPTAILTGPSFASDIASGLPTALTLASSDVSFGETLQHALSTDALRLYLSDDPRGAELGGALKNVIAIACGICMGAKLGESARAALMTRGFAEMQRIAVALGASTETLAGLAGFGDLALTCTSSQSRNFSFGYALGAGTTQPDATTEGRATSRAVVKLAAQHGVDMPIANAVAGMVEGRTSLEDALDALLSRPLGKE
ncbi:glycerol-3-phosphate dehydrogenase [NAD(P)+] [Litoreibacter roseus]|uniref:Glycerol-3-phosphate dehydrogenase n=1 Tax=Litoreibacter roseus TaxID=2601869 RepID=A0A6N6JG53_9RHOB|nr:glycerol-3-phosphate dehydrogenase [NAD(P)+] [Litoreibacter roseus]